MRIWKIVGLAGLASVAATGAVVARSERKRRAYTPEEVRARLHERAAASAAGPPVTDGRADGPTARIVEAEPDVEEQP